MNVIHLSDAMNEMKGDKPFSIVFVTCDQSRDSGGDIITLENVVLSFNQNAADKAGFEMPEPARTPFNKRANHYEYATRNVRLQNGMIRKFHIRLLEYFNGKKVFY
ncbi:hypothetical protein [Algoriphagus resistens]|uniref:hypothetical protein n=1 Tax=Algoriphagus resistens TaxID=1750590 RepID=UPI0007167CDA|nr:hypothetical protein [Algoriphagus resistens]